MNRNECTSSYIFKSVEIGILPLEGKTILHCTAHLKTFGTGTGLVFWIQGRSTRLKFVSHLPSAGVLLEDIAADFFFF